MARGKLSQYVSVVTSKFNDLYNEHKTEIDNHITSVKQQNDYNNLKVRIAFDLARVLRYWDWEFLSNCNTNVITTLLTQALDNSQIDLTK